MKKYPTLSFYRQGEFIDLCRGPHIPHAGKVGAFKLLSIAGAYWKNDATRKQLQRLYGTAFFNQKDLDAYLHQLEEAKKRDHRVLGKQLKLFTISQMVGSGLILWMPQGGDGPRHPRNLHQGRTAQTRLLAGLHPAHRPAGTLPHQRAFSLLPRRPVSADVSPPRGRDLDLCQYRLAMGEIDDKREHEYQEYMKQAHMLPPQYHERRRQAASSR